VIRALSNQVFDECPVRGRTHRSDQIAYMC